MENGLNVGYWTYHPHLFSRIFNGKEEKRKVSQGQGQVQMQNLLRTSEFHRQFLRMIFPKHTFWWLEYHSKFHSSLWYGHRSVQHIFRVSWLTGCQSKLKTINRSRKIINLSYGEDNNWRSKLPCNGIVLNKNAIPMTPDMPISK